MNLHRLPTIGLHVYLATRRLGVPNFLTILFSLAGAVAWLYGIPFLRTDVDTRQEAVLHAKQQLQSNRNLSPTLRPSPSRERLAAFYDALGEKHYVEQQVKTLFSIADKTKLTLSQADYRLAFDKNGRFYTYQVTLPVKGVYEDIRRFCERVLLAVPFASLDEISFKRDAITSGAVEARLRFSLYLADISNADQTQSAGPREVAE